MRYSSRVMSIEIRQAQLADYREIIALWQRAGLSYEPEGRDSLAAITRQIKANGRLILLAQNTEGAAVGVVFGSHDGRKGWINRLAVDPAHRREGIAGQLVQAAEAALKQEGISIVAALVEEPNPASMALFKRLGYSERRDIIYFRKPFEGD